MRMRDVLATPSLCYGAYHLAFFSLFFMVIDEAGQLHDQSKICSSLSIPE